MIPKEFKCPNCDSAEIQISTKEYSVEIPFSDPVLIELDYYLCEGCGFESTYGIGDPFEEARNIGLGLSIKKMIENLSQKGFNQSFIEHVLELPPRTLTTWKNGKISKGAVALLRAVNVFPEILEVAQFSWIEDKVREIKIRSSAEVIGSIAPNLSRLAKKSTGVKVEVNNDSEGVFSNFPPEFEVVYPLSKEIQFVSGTESGEVTIQGQNIDSICAGLPN